MLILITRACIVLQNFDNCLISFTIGLKVNNKKKSNFEEIEVLLIFQSLE